MLPAYLNSFYDMKCPVSSPRKCRKEMSQRNKNNQYMLPSRKWRIMIDMWQLWRVSLSSMILTCLQGGKRYLRCSQVRAQGKKEMCIILSAEGICVQLLWQARIKQEINHWMLKCWWQPEKGQKQNCSTSGEFIPRPLAGLTASSAHLPHHLLTSSNQAVSASIRNCLERPCFFGKVFLVLC